MKTLHTLLTVVVAVVALAGPAQAATLLATGLGITTNGAECVASNIGSRPVLVNSMNTFDGAGNMQTIVSTNCSFPGYISPGLSCFISVNSTGGVRCTIELATSAGARNTRGTLQLFNPGPAQVLDAR